MATAVSETASESPIEMSAVDSLGASPTHPLRRSWQFWIRNRDSKMKKGRESSHEWQKDLHPIGAPVTTVEAFWNGIAETLRQDGTNFFLFQEGVQPAWEDPKFMTGGSVNLNFSGPEFNDTARSGFVLTCAMLIGEHFDGDIVCGATYGTKAANSRVELWLSVDDLSSMGMCSEKVLEAIAQMHYEFFPNVHTKLAHEAKPFRSESRRVRTEEIPLEKIIFEHRK